VIARLGWRRQPDDPRDHHYAVPRAAVVAPAADLRAHMPPVWDQGQIGSCTAHGSHAVAAACRIAAGFGWTPLSRLQTYFDARRIGGFSTAEDSGANIRDAIKALAKYGAAPEDRWPYITDRFAKRPGVLVYLAALRWQALRYQAVPATRDGLRAALAAGFPVTFGFDVYANFEGIGADGVMPMPAGECQGGHCITAVGYADGALRTDVDDIPAGGHLIIRNSWGPDWGRRGHFYMPYDALAACHASDGWTITQMEHGA
jgi:hypothetical protein